MYFPYGKAEVEYWKGRDKISGAVTDESCHAGREVDSNLFFSIVHHIIGRK